MKIYLAGPLFSTAERDFNARLAGLLAAVEIRAKMAKS
jgi:nucleoside 2-deoxyribosyltransferase